MAAVTRAQHELRVAAQALASRYGGRLPWRGPRDYEPWRVLVREVLLCRTSSRAARRPLRNLFKQWPEPEDLAAAATVALEAMIAPLGMQRVRACRLRVAAALTIELGGVPRTLTRLLQFPGVGDYVARAVQRLAFGLATAPVDGVTCRVFDRTGVAPGTLYRELDRAFGNRRLPLHALVWLGGEHCRPRVPHCDDCPLAPACEMGR